MLELFRIKLKQIKLHLGVFASVKGCSIVPVTRKMGILVKSTMAHNTMLLFYKCCEVSISDTYIWR